MDKTNEPTPIPGYPGYAITPDGTVYSKRKNPRIWRKLRGRYPSKANKELYYQLFPDGEEYCQRSISELLQVTFGTLEED